ncbi:MAG: glycosyltransferase family 39 protein [Elusimicrobiota bacterium]|nr:MAG: glycosyltransferase family 39 protein [Elusimicrobiota bacterium]
MLVYRAVQAFSDSPVAPRAAAILAALLTALVLLALTPTGWSAPGRLAAPLSLLVLSTTPVGDFGFAANTEAFAMLPSAMAVWFSLRAGRYSAVLAGLCAGAAVMTKQTAVWPGLAALALASWRGAKKWDARAASGFVAGAAAVPAAFVLYFAARGGLPEFWDCVVAGNMRYASIAGWGAAAEQGRFFALELAPAFLKGGWPAWALAAYGLAGLEPRRENAGALAAALWLAGGCSRRRRGCCCFPTTSSRPRRRWPWPRRSASRSSAAARRPRSPRSSWSPRSPTQGCTSAPAGSASRRTSSTRARCSRRSGSGRSSRPSRLPANRSGCSAPSPSSTSTRTAARPRATTSCTR